MKKKTGLCLLLSTLFLTSCTEPIKAKKGYNKLKETLQLDDKYDSIEIKFSSCEYVYCKTTDINPAKEVEFCYYKVAFDYSHTSETCYAKWKVDSEKITYDCSQENNSLKSQYECALSDMESNIIKGFKGTL